MTLCHEDNTFDHQMVKAIHEALDQVESSDAQVLLTIGNGRFYSNGLNLKNLSAGAGSKEEIRDRIQVFIDLHFLPLLARMLSFEVPSISLVNGHAFAGGWMFSMCHDYRIMNKDHGFLCMNEIDIGLPLVIGSLK